MIVFGSVVKELNSLGYTPTEPAVSPFKPINRLLKTDCYNGTTYIEPMTLIIAYLIKPENS